MVHMMNCNANKDAFYKISQQCKCVIACRASPKQKLELVDLVRKQNLEKSTLSIGDGANDVNMIQGANVGIGY